MKSIEFIILIFIFSLLGSTKESQNTEVLKLALKSSNPAEYGHNYILVNPSDFIVTDNYIYAAEKDISHVVVFDRDFNYLNTIGKYGEGPEDF